MSNLYYLGRRFGVLLGAGLFFSQLGYAQSVGVGTTTPHSSAVLDVNSTGKGFLPPRMSQAQRDAITTPAQGLTVFNTDTQRVNVWDGTSWSEVLATTQFTGGGPGVTTTFSYTGTPQTYTVPAGVTKIQVTADGSSGQNYFAVPGGLGARVTATLTVVPGEVLTVQVGGVTYNGGGSGVGAGAGGGATDLRRTGASTGDYLSSRNALLVAGGGGGSSNFFSAVGGTGGTPAGTDGGDGNGGSGADQTGPGTGNGPAPGQAGTDGTGGNGIGSFGTGGGGGYYGGGGGGISSGGGGGSSWVTPIGSRNVTYAVVPTNTLGSLTITTIPTTYPAPTLDASNFVNLPANTGPAGPTGPQGPVGPQGPAGTDASVTASNGIGILSGNLTLGGALTQATIIGLNNNDLSFAGSGRVGIGVNNPAYALHIGDGVTSGSAHLMLQGAFGQTNYLQHGRVQFNDPNFGFGAGNFGNGGDDDLYFYTYDGPDRDFRFMHTPNGLSDPNGAGWTTDLIIKQGGNVGIGTSTPNQRLEVAGQVYSSTGGFRFPDNTVQTTAATTVPGPQGPQGPQGPVGPQGPAGTNGTNATVTASNGVSVAGGNVTLGGTLSQNTTIAQGGNTLSLTGGNVGIGTATPNAKAALDISATDKGLLIPRMTQAQRTAMTSVPAGLMVFQTDGSTPGFWYYFGSQWNAIPNMANVPGDNLGNHTATQDFNLGNNALIASGTNVGLSVTRTATVGAALGIATLADDAVSITGLNPLGTKINISNASGGGAGNQWMINTKPPEVPAPPAPTKYQLDLAGPGAGVSFVKYSNSNNLRLGINTDIPTATLHVAGTGSSVRVDGLAGTGNRMLTVSSTGDFVAQALPVADNLGNHSATQNLALNDFDMRLRGDSNHGLGWYGGSKTWNGVNVDGPVLYGWGGGILGTNQAGTRNTSLYWNYLGQIGIGTTTPRGVFDVGRSGDIYLTTNPINSQQQRAYLPGDISLASYASSSMSNISYLQAGGALQIRAKNSGNPVDAMYIQQDGKVSIGGTGSTRQLDVVGDAKVSTTVFARALSGLEYETAYGPGRFVDNAFHSVECNPNWGIVSLRAYATSSLDGDMMLNCTNLTGLINSSTGYWTGSIGLTDNYLHSASCNANEIATGWRAYATSYLDGYVQLLCRSLNSTYFRGTPFSTTNVQGALLSNTPDNQYQGGACPPGSFITGIGIRAAGYLEAIEYIECATVSSQ